MRREPDSVRGANVANAIANIPFAEGVTNTAEGLHQAYSLLKSMDDGRQALNIIVLLTGGRPNAFTGVFEMSESCDGGARKKGGRTAMIGQSWPPLPPEQQGEREYLRSDCISLNGHLAAT